MKLKKTEKEIQKQVIDYLKLTGWSVYRTNNAGIFNKKNDCYIFHGKKGLPDIIAIKGDILIFAEIKSATGKLSPDQVEFQRLASNVHNIMAFTVRNLDDLLVKISATKVINSSDKTQ